VSTTPTPCAPPHARNLNRNQQGTRSTGEEAAKPRSQLSRRRTGPGGSRSLGASDEDGALLGDDFEPELSIPQLATGLQEAEIKDLAYLIVAATCRCARAAASVWFRFNGSLACAALDRRLGCMG